MAKNKAELTNKAHEFMSKGQWKKALAEFENAFALDKNDPLITLRMGDVHLKLGNRDGASKSYLRTAAMFAKQGHVPKALATYKMILRVDPSLTGVQDKIDELINIPRIHPAVEAPNKPAATANPVKIPLLFDLSTSELWELLGKMKRNTYAEGDTVVKEGEEGASLFIIRKGRVKVITSINGNEVVLARLGERDFFGEVSFLTGRPRTADIVACEPSEIMELGREDLNEIIKTHPKVEGTLRLFHESRVSDTVASLKAVAKDFFK